MLLSTLKKSHLLICLDDTKYQQKVLTCEEFILMLEKLPKYLIIDCRKCPIYNIDNSLLIAWEQSHCSLILTDNQDKNTWKENLFNSLEEQMRDFSATTKLIETRTMNGLFECALIQNRADAQNGIASELFQYKYYTLARKYYRMAAEQHYRTAILELANMYEGGTGGCIKSYERANYWLRKLYIDNAEDEYI